MPSLDNDPVSYANQVSFDKKINTPFAESGDKTEIPEESNYDLVNQKEGFTELYETPIGEGGEYVERQTINQVLYDTQSAVKEIQDMGEGDGFPANLENSNGILPVVNGGTGNSSGKAPSAETADSASVADEAVKLQTARTIRTNLASESTASFDGTANITPGVTGTLPVGHGGTGITSNPSMLINLASNSSASVFASSPRPGVTGVLPIENGGTGASSVAGLLSSINQKYFTITGTYVSSIANIFGLNSVLNSSIFGLFLEPMAGTSSSLIYKFTLQIPLCFTPDAYYNNTVGCWYAIFDTLQTTNPGLHGGLLTYINSACSLNLSYLYIYNHFNASNTRYWSSYAIMPSKSFYTGYTSNADLSFDINNYALTGDIHYRITDSDFKLRLSGIHNVNNLSGDIYVMLALCGICY